MNIIVLAGGYSPERDVSLTSGSLIANALMEEGHRVLLLDVYEGLREIPVDPLTLFRTTQRYHYQVTESIPDLDALKARCGNGDALIGPGVIELCRAADKVFLALHGAMGENGQLQATLDSFGIPYTGSGYLGSALAMNKDLAKRLFRDAGIPTPDWVCLRPNGKEDLQALPLPCVVKPCSCGSSVGISMADTAEELKAALAEAARWEDTVLVEQKITGREFTVGILDGKALPLVEIIPAELSPEDTQRAQSLALAVFDALHLKGYARVDVLMDGDGGLWVLEANTLPGMTPTSLLPQAAAAVGISYNQLCKRIIDLA